MLGPFIDTIVVCTLTALVMLLTGAWAHGPAGVEGAALTSYAFSTVYGKGGAFLVDIAIILFAFSTIISWSYYGALSKGYALPRLRQPAGSTGLISIRFF